MAYPPKRLAHGLSRSTIICGVTSIFREAPDKSSWGREELERPLSICFVGRGALAFVKQANGSMEAQ